MSLSISRRQVLAVLGAGFGGVVVGITTLGRGPRESHDLVTLIETDLRPDERSRELGRTYLERFPELNSIERLIQAIGTPSGPGGAWLRDKVTREFREGATLFLDGWLVSETEACLCAVAYLATP